MRARAAPPSGQGQAARGEGFRVSDRCSLPSAMAAPWEDVLCDTAAIREAALVAVDAALLAGVLMRTEGLPNASDVSAGAESGAFGPGRAVSQHGRRGAGRSCLPARLVLSPPQCAQLHGWSTGDVGRRNSALWASPM